MSVAAFDWTVVVFAENGQEMKVYASFRVSFKVLV